MLKFYHLIAQFFFTGTGQYLFGPDPDLPIYYPIPKTVFTTRKLFSNKP
jgi:hypothetical protein